MKSKTIAALLGIIMGGMGLHHFYLGNIMRGILYLCLCWTFIPAFLGFFQGLALLAMSEERFNKIYN